MSRDVSLENNPRVTSELLQEAMMARAARKTLDSSGIGHTYKQHTHNPHTRRMILQ